MAPRLPALLLAATAVSLFLWGPAGVLASGWGPGSAATPAPSPSGQPAAPTSGGGGDCSSLASSITGICSAELNVLAPTYSPMATALPTEQERTQATSDLKAGGLPSPDCCNALKPWAQARCHCDESYAQALAALGVDRSWAAGVGSIMAPLCGLDFNPSC